MIGINRIAERCKAWGKRYYCEIFLIAVFVYLAFYQIYYSYIASVGITPDSANYLLEAEAILKGFGYSQTGIAGYKTWFCAWPAGYPALIAAMAFLTGRNVYLSSKILSIILMGLCLAVFYLRFKKDAWIYAFTLFNYGILTIYYYTWSENPFLLGLLVFILSLSEIVSRENPSKRWYVFMGIGSIFSFLSRYFGTVTLIIAALATCVCAVRYFFGFIDSKDRMRKKLIRLVCTDTAAAAVMGAYYLINYRMCGYLSGVQRSVFLDDKAALKVNLYDALRREFFNAIRLEMPLTVSGMSVGQQAALLLLGFGILVYLVYGQLKRKADDKAICILSGMLYDAVFIVIRFHSTMDEFNFRFFAPASMLITIGVFGLILEKMREGTKIKLCIVSAAVVSILSVSLCEKIQTAGFKHTAYRSYKETIEQQLEHVPEKSVILFYDGDYCAKFIRPDILFERNVFCPEQIGREDTIQELFERYQDSDYICIKAKTAREIGNDPSGYDPSVYEFFKKLVPEGTGDEEYITISVSGRCLA